MEQDSVYFFDLDGTLYDDNWRLDLVDHQKNDPWHEYHSASIKDDLIIETTYRMVRSCIETNTPFFFLSARPQKYMKITEMKLQQTFPDLNIKKLRNVILRANFEDSVAEWKAENIRLTMLMPGFVDKSPILVDDRQDCCEAVKAIGGNAIQVALVHSNHPAKVAGYLLEGIEPKTWETFLPLMRIHSDRHRSYGLNYLTFGKVFSRLFQDQSPAGVTSEKDWNRLAILNHIVNKLTRYCSSWPEPGDSDSLDDLAVYALILKEIDGGTD